MTKKKLANSQPCLLATAICLSACSVRTVAVRGAADIIHAGTPAFYEEPDARLAREALPSQLKLMESLLKSDPDNAQLLKSLSEGFIGYAFLYIEDEDPQRARELYRRALEYGLRLLAANSAFADLEHKSADAVDAALKNITDKDVPGLYWTATAWAGWANLSKNDPEALVGLPKALRMMARVQELCADYQFGGPDLFFGVYFAARPRLAGGDARKARTYFESAIARNSGNYLMAKLLYAKYYAVATLDADLFRKLNREILDARADLLPQARLANEIAKIKAKRLLERTNEFF